MDVGEATTSGDGGGAGMMPTPSRPAHQESCRSKVKEPSYDLSIGSSDGALSRSRSGVEPPIRGFCGATREFTEVRIDSHRFAKVPAQMFTDSREIRESSHTHTHGFARIRTGFALEVLGCSSQTGPMDS